jgi:hypothetical protein
LGKRGDLLGNGLCTCRGRGGRLWCRSVELLPDDFHDLAEIAFVPFAECDDIVSPSQLLDARHRALLCNASVTDLHISVHDAGVHINRGDLPIAVGHTLSAKHGASSGGPGFDHQGSSIGRDQDRTHFPIGLGEHLFVWRQGFLQFLPFGASW